MELKKAFGIILRKLRLNKSLSQEELAFQSGIHRTYISLLERGIKSPSLNILFKLSNSLEIPPSKIILKVENLYKKDKNL